MIIPDTEEIIYVAKNELKKTKFYIQSFIISIIPAGFLSCLYILLQSLNIYAYFAFVFLIYVCCSIVSANQTYKNYERYFGSDELAISKTHIYYNICMNVKGEYQNFDSNKTLNSIKDVYIKSGWNPKALVITFRDETHITIHSLKNIDEVYFKLTK